MTTIYHIQIVGNKAQIQQPGYKEQTYDLAQIKGAVQFADPERQKVLLKAANLLYKNLHHQHKKGAYLPE